jgi:hypothetical protein
MHTLTRFFHPTILWLLAFTLAVTSSCSEKETVVPKSTEKSITGFSFASLTPAVTATISGNSIAATVPFGTNLTLAPTITASAKATVSPASGSAQDFSKAVTYTVTAEDGSTQTYTVNVGVGVAPKSSAKDITAFAFNGLNPAVNGTVDATAKTISATLAAGTDATKLVPTVTVSAKATVSPASGVAQDFSKAVTYTVTAEDGSTQVYTANLTVPKLTTVIIDCGNVPLVWEDLGDGVDYVVNCKVRIEKDVIIKPGVRIQFAPGAGFQVFNSAPKPSLNMVGTAAKPIILEGKTATAGSWQGITVTQAPSLSNQWEYVTLRHAGDGQTAGVEITSSNVAIKNCTFSDNKGYGIALLDDGTIFKAFDSNTFTNNTKSALQVFFKQAGYLDSKSSYTNNGQNYIQVEKSNFQSDITDDVTLLKLNVPYRIQKAFTIPSPRKLTIKPGVTLEFGSDTYLETGNGAALVADGTAVEPIKFVGYLANTNGVWAGLLLGRNVETKLNYCVIDGAGSATMSTTDFNFRFERDAKAAIVIQDGGYRESGKCTITNSSVTNSGGYGIAYSKFTKDSFTLKDNTFKDNKKANTIEFDY